MRARRALLYVPGDDMHKIQKATTLGVDCICLDLEDGVAYNRKSTARTTIAEALETLDFAPAEKLVRINPVGSGLESADLNAVLPGRPDGIVMPKVRNAEQVHWVCDQLTDFEKQMNWSLGAIGLILLIETAHGVLNLTEIAGAESRLQALIFGSEDLAGEIGAQRTSAGWEIFHARSLVLLHAAAHAIQAIDMVFIDFHDLDGLKAEALQGARLGFNGKQIIHPNQVEIVQAAFTPTNEAVEQARQLIAAYEEHQSAGRGAFALDGKMIDAPLIKSARNVLARARAAEKL
jgi:citrate lyase beta subunit